ncbi:MAG: DUF2971 domain-containing protein [Clostridia bacterium]
MSDFIYHYTTIETLALILSNSSIKFNSLSKVDDMQEAMTKDFGNLSNYIFVSCWTKDKDENIGLWNMYAKNMSGIRIGVNKDFLKPDIVNFGKKYGKVKNITNSEISCLSYGFYHEIEYLDDNAFTLIEELKEGEPLKEYVIDKAGMYKKKSWEFQKEVRFILHAITLNTNTDKADRYFYFNSIINQENKTGLDSIYLNFDLMKFNEAEIMIGPKSSEADKIIVESLIYKYIPNFNGMICRSRLGIR